MAWYDIPNTTCLFALDFNSSVTGSGSVVYFTNTLKEYLTVLSPNPNKVRKEVLYDTTTKNFNVIFPKRWYKSLRLENAFLTFKNPVAIPDEFTMILKTRLKGPSIFFDTSNIGSGFGPCFNYETLGQSDTVWYTWRIDGFVSGQDYVPSIRAAAKDSITTLVIKGSRLRNEGLFITDYGTYLLGGLNNDVFTPTGVFGASKSFIQMGYSSGSTVWDPDANIIAYGLFNKELSDAELEVVFQNIDAEFEIKDEEINFVDYDSTLKTGFSFKNYFKKFNMYTLNNQLFSDTKMYRPISTDSVVKLLDTKLLKIDTQVPEMVSLKDFVYEEDLPVQTDLYLLERHSGQIIKRTRSNSEGFFEFLNLDPNLEYIIISPDVKYQYKSVIKDYDFKRN